VIVALLVACTGTELGDSAGETGDSAPSGPGTIAVTVKMEDDLLVDLAEDGESAIAKVSGEVFAEADVNEALGPNEGAVPLGAFSADVDLSVDGGPSGVIFTSEPMEAQIIYVLGCLDTDANGDCGDEGDPVTFPSQNKFQTEAGVETAIQMMLGLRRPGGG
jgi:hypothetical protein